MVNESFLNKKFKEGFTLAWALALEEGMSRNDFFYVKPDKLTQKGLQSTELTKMFRTLLCLKKL